jgi:hypothetical protein
MQIDLEKGISLKIEGELGKYQTLSVDALIKISQTLQELVLSIAKNDLDASQTIDLSNFKLELDEFTKSSAVPRFVFTQRVAPTFDDFEEQRKDVNKKVNDILSLATTGNYYELRDMYPNASVRNEIVEHVYNFTNSFKGSPVKIYGLTQGDSSYKIQKFKPEVRKNLLVEIKEVAKDKSDEKAFATVKITKTGNKTRNQIQKVYKTHHNSLSYSPEVMNINGKQYIFNYPLRCLFEEEDNFFVINNEQLGIIGTGMTQEEAEENFNEEFDFLYNRLNSLNDDKLGKNMLNAKTIINLVVKEVI